MTFKRNIWKKPPQEKRSKVPALGIIAAGSLFASSKANASSVDAVVEELMKVVKPIFDKVFGQMMDGLLGSVSKAESEVTVAIGRSVDAAIEVRKLAHNNELRDQTRVTTDVCVDDQAGQIVRAAEANKRSTIASIQKESAAQGVSGSSGWLQNRRPVYSEFTAKILTSSNGVDRLDFESAVNLNVLGNAGATPQAASGKVPTMARDFTTAEAVKEAKFVADTVFAALKLQEQQLVQEQVDAGDLRAKENTQRELGSNSRRNNFQSAFYKQIAERSSSVDGGSIYSGFEKRLRETYYNPDYFEDLSDQNAPTPPFGVVLRETSFGNALAFKRHELNVQRTAMLYTLLADEMSVVSARDASKYSAIIIRN